MLSDHVKTAEGAIERIIDRGRRLDSTNHERRLAWLLLNDPAYKRDLTEKLARRHW